MFNSRYFTGISVIVVFCLTATLCLGMSLEADASSPTVDVNWHDKTGLSVTVQCPSLELVTESTDYGSFTRITFPGTPVKGKVGEPQLPVIRRMFCVPKGAKVQSAFDIQATSTQMLAHPVLPAQAPMSVDTTLTRDQVMEQNPESLSIANLIPETFQYSEESYARSQDTTPVDVVFVGTARDMDLYLLEVTPFHYSAKTQQLEMTELIQVTLSFSGGSSKELHRLPTGISDAVLNPPLQSPRGSETLLIIAAPDFAGSAPLQQFITAKTSQGYNVLTYYPPLDTYYLDVRAHIQSLWGTASSPDYVLLVGDGYDRWDVNHDNIPHWSGDGSKRGITDQTYVCMDGEGDWIPDIPIGRFSVETVGQLQAIVDKVLYVESGNYSDPGYAGRSVFLTGIQEGETYHEQAIQAYTDPAGVTPVRVYARQGATTQDLSNAFNAGASLVNMFGHAAGCQAWGSPLFVYDDIESLTNTNKYPFVLCFNCSGGAYHYDEESGCSPGFLEKMMIEPSRGAAASYGNSRNQDPYTWDSWGVLYDEWIKAFYVDGHREIGNAMMSARANFIAYYGVDDPVSHDWTDCFNIQGDPTMKLPLPQPEKLLVVTPPLFAGSSALNDYVSQKTSKGFKVVTYVVPVGTSNTDIKAYIQSLWQTSDQPSYITIIGDTSGSSSDNETIPHFSGGGDKSASTDWPYGCMDGGDDWYPDIPVGRISVTSTGSLNDVVKKIKHVESGNFSDPSYVQRGLFLVNNDTYNVADETHEYIVDHYLTPNGYDGTILYGADGANEVDVTREVDDGTMFTVYMGHSSSSGWWNPSFDQGDVNGLSNQGLYGITMGWSCNSANYPYDECFGETWLRAADKGAAAYISASTYIYWGSLEAWAPSGSMEKAVFASLFDDDIWVLGDMWISTQRRFLADHGAWDGDESHDPSQNYQHCRNFVEEFVILGDPALQIPRPYTFSMSVSPESADSCAPDNAYFNINCTEVGGYSDSITLSVSGAPVGLTIGFSQNNQAPPFTSILTISDTDQVAAGTYTITVEAAGADGTNKTKQVDVSITSQAPGAFSLTAPSDGNANTSRQPTFIWEASADATSYKISIAEDDLFGNIVNEATVITTSYACPVMLVPDTTYYWKVSAQNGCGKSTSDTFSFTTIDQADYFSEDFQSGFDLDGYSLTLVPDGGGNFYSACVESITELPVDPTAGDYLPISGDDGNALINPAMDILFYGQSYDSVYVNANGHLTFDSPDGDWQESITKHFNYKRIAPMYDDLTVSSQNPIRWKESPDRISVTWNHVPTYGNGDSNTFQVEIFESGIIRMSWLGIASSRAVVGISAGGGLPDDFQESDLSSYGQCPAAFTGACCTEETCEETLAMSCLASGGTFWGIGTTCDTNPCVEYETCCLVISEVVQGKESGDCPRWIEITNTGQEAYFFAEGGVIVQSDDDTDTLVDVDLSGFSIPAGESFVITSKVEGHCTGAFNGIYGQAPDLSVDFTFGVGNERFMLTDTADGSHIFDTYGEAGVNGTGTPWEFTGGYSYRSSDWIRGNDENFHLVDWFFGGVDSLAGSNPTGLLLSLTTPGTHTYTGACYSRADINGDGSVDLDDFVLFEGCITGPESANNSACDAADIDRDRDIDLEDFAILTGHYGM